MFYQHLNLIGENSLLFRRAPRKGLWLDQQLSWLRRGPPAPAPTPTIPALTASPSNHPAGQSHPCSRTVAILSHPQRAARIGEFDDCQAIDRRVGEFDRAGRQVGRTELRWAEKTRG